MDVRPGAGPATLARTVLSTSHVSSSVRLDGAAHPAAGPVGLLAVGAQPYLVPSDPNAFFATGTALRCVVSIADVGTVTATGTTGLPTTAGDHAGLVATLEDHRGCLVGPVDAALLRVVPLQLFALEVSAPGEDVSPVTPAELAAARPDWLLARGRRLTRHLETEHAADLTMLAAAHGVPGAASVSLTRLSMRGATLVCLAADGVTTVDLVFDPPVAGPGELWRRLSASAAAERR